MIEHTYMITCVDDEYDRGLFWSNEFGWGALGTADSFSEEERNTLNLPMDGEWVKERVVVAIIRRVQKDYYESGLCTKG